jgi:hypothetical protein
MRMPLLPRVIALFMALSLHAENPRRTVIISDTHFGVGADHSIEDFRWSGEWRAFLAELRKSTVPTDLILNGDSLELWQTLGNECQDPRPEVGCTEHEALARLRKVIDAHEAEFKELRDFANHGANRVIIIPGNHDAALLYDDVGKALLAAIAAKSDRVSIARAGHWRSADGLIYAEHGHQADAANRFSRWPEVMRTIDDVVHLERPWGEQFVQRFYNEIEATYPTIDNIITEGDAIRYAIAAEGFNGTHHQVGRVAAFILLHTTLGQSTWTLRDVSTPASENSEEWNVKAARQQGPQFFVDSVSTTDPARTALLAAAKAGTFNDAFNGLTDDDIIEICNERAALHAKDRSFVLCPFQTLNQAIEAKRRGQGKMLRSYIERLRRTAPEKPFKLVVLAHTHAAHDPLEFEFDGGSVNVVNAGAWQRLLPANDLENYQRRKGLTAKAVLADLTLYRLAPCYTYVDIPPYKKVPAARLKYWTGDAIATKCVRTVREK